jgi:predicted nucleic-acid-binding Zn-ribbon protein
MKLHPCFKCGHTQPELVNDPFGLFYRCPKCQTSSYTDPDAEWAGRAWNDLCELGNPSLKSINQEPTTVYVVLDLVPCVFSTLEAARERVYQLRPQLFSTLNADMKPMIAAPFIHETKLQ